MRIIVSGTHASGKSTLISDFRVRHPEYVLLTDPYELLDESDDGPSASMFASQLRFAAARLLDDDLARDVIAERGPIDFLAYLLAMADLSARPIAPDVLERAIDLTRRSVESADLLVVLPLSSRDPIRAGDDEHPELRAAMDGRLLDLLDDPDIVGATIVVEITGTPEERLRALEDAVAARP